MTSIEQEARAKNEPHVYIIKITADGLFHHQAVGDQDDIKILDQVLEKIRANAASAVYGFDGSPKEKGSAESAEPVAWMNADFNTILHSAMENWRLQSAANQHRPEDYSHYVLSHYTIPLYAHPAPVSTSPAASGQGVDVDRIMKVVGEWLGPGTGISLWMDADLRTRLASLGAADPWIPVSSGKLPEDGTYVEIYDLATEPELPFDIALYSDGEWHGQIAPMKLNPTHWKPWKCVPPLAGRGEDIDPAAP